MKSRHNKKRNTVFLYEILIREMAKTVVNKDLQKKKLTLSVLKEHFNKDSILYKEMQIFKDILQSENLDKQIAEKLINESKTVHAKLDKKQLFLEQSIVISKINKFLSKDAFSNFVPNYKSIASISQMFGDNGSIKKKVLLEKEIIEKITSKREEEKEVKPIDSLVFKTFLKKFNTKYDNLNESQKALLNKYILSFLFNGVELKLFLNEEIERLKNSLDSSLEMKEVIDDERMFEATKKVLSKIQGFKDHPINEDMIKDILKIQNLVEELEN